MARIPVDNGSDIVTWSRQKPGATFEGTFMGQRDGQYGALYDLHTNEGPITLASVTVLAKKMARVRVGGFVAIEYLGKKASKKPGAKDFHDFNLFVDKADDLLPARRGASAPQSADGVPF